VAGSQKEGEKGVDVEKPNVELCPSDCVMSRSSEKKNSPYCMGRMFLLLL
jgi:hypothetical protein